MFQGIRTGIAKKPYSFVIFQGWRPDSCPQSRSVHVRAYVFVVSFPLYHWLRFTHPNLHKSFQISYIWTGKWDRIVLKDQTRCHAHTASLEYYHPTGEESWLLGFYRLLHVTFLLLTFLAVTRVGLWYYMWSWHFLLVIHTLHEGLDGGVWYSLFV